MSESTKTKSSTHAKKIAIIGAGCSGLTAIKSCLDEGLIPKCFERSDTIGGLWNYSDTVVPGTASIYKSLVINTSKDMMMFSDFPAPESYPPFLTHDKVIDYFHLYAEHFRLLQHIHFNTVVLNIKKADTYESTGEWCVHFSKKHAGNDDNDTSDHHIEYWQEIFQGVMICTGHHSTPYVPKIDGIDTFGGSVLHSHAYKSPETFQDKTVLIVGLGNSAADIACDLAKTAKNVYLSSRRGAWIVPRTAFWGLPADMLANSRLVFTMPYSVLDWCVQKQANFRLDHQTYGLKPNHGVLNCHPSINDELPIHLVNGRVQIKSNIRRVEKDGVLLEDDTFLTCDVIIMATGYDYRLDCISPDILKIENNSTELYEYVFPPHLPHPTLAVIGLVQAIGAVMPISEIQSRWFARVITGASSLPPLNSMIQDIRAKRTEMDTLYVQSRRHTLQTFWIEYMDKIASHIQAKPNLSRMLFTDPELALKCFLGPCFPAQYRLTGPGKWSGARQFIVTAMSRAFLPRHIRTTHQPSDKANTEFPKTLEPCKETLTSTNNAHQTTHNTNPPEFPKTLEHPRETPAPIISTKNPATSTAHQIKQNTSPQIAAISKSAVPTTTTTTTTTPGHSRFDPRGVIKRRWHPEWMTMTFYMVLVSFCCLAWVLAVLFDKAENVLSFFEQTVGRYLPVTD